MAKYIHTHTHCMGEVKPQPSHICVSQSNSSTEKPNTDLSASTFSKRPQRDENHSTRWSLTSRYVNIQSDCILRARKAIKL